MNGDNHLRREAERRLQSLPRLPRGSRSSASREDLVHELDVQELELELQNEQLRGAEQALDASRRSSEARWEETPLALVTLDTDGRITESNAAASRLLGVRRDVVAGTPLSAFLGRSDADTLHLLRQRVLATGTRASSEATIRRHDGTLTSVVLVIAATFDGSVHYRCALLDVGELRPSKPPPSPPVPVRSRGTALLVDDEALVRRALHRQLVHLGFEAVEADTVPRALEVLSAHDGELAVLVSDVVMPGARGPELAAAARELHPDLPILFVSGSTTDTLGPLGSQTKTAFLAKPFELAALDRALRSLISAPKRKPTLLFVDGDADRRSDWKERLANRGMRVFTAASGAEAVVLGATWAVDLVVANARLPDGAAIGFIDVIATLQPSVAAIQVSNDHVVESVIEMIDDRMRKRSVASL